MKENAIDILIIEDNPGDILLVSETLKEHEDPLFRIHAVSRLDEGLKMLETEHLDIVLMDLGLPDSSGLEGLKKITDRAGSPPVVVLTGLEDESAGVGAGYGPGTEFCVTFPVGEQSVKS